MEAASLLLQEIRYLSGLSQRQLALRAKTSSATMSNYETGKIEPMLSTLVRLADAAGVDLVVEIQPRLTKRERRSLELHKAVAKKFAANPTAIRQKALTNIAHMRGVHNDGSSDIYFDAWESVLGGTDVQVMEVLTSSSQRARMLQHVSPFAGVLTNDERREILEWLRVESSFK